MVAKKKTTKQKKSKTDLREISSHVEDQENIGNNNFSLTHLTTDNHKGSLQNTNGDVIPKAVDKLSEALEQAGIPR